MSIFDAGAMDAGKWAAFARREREMTRIAVAGLVAIGLAVPSLASSRPREPAAACYRANSPTLTDIDDTAWQAAA